MKKVIIIEDNMDICLSYSMLINKTSNYKVINTYQSGETAILNLSTDAPDIALVDINLQGNMNGIEVTKQIKITFPKIEIVIITIYENSNLVFESLSKGASGYLIKNSNKNEIIEALDLIIKGGSPMSPSIARMVVESFKKNIINNPFSEKENLVLDALVNGKSYKSIAVYLEISLDTVRYHIKNIYLKLQVKTKEEAISKAKTNNWI
ncbi:MAG: DNA-binding response regulator [Cytophagales bacterium]|nr:MAG: DNA-binding response regulator [Cytophagales bacterium]